MLEVFHGLGILHDDELPFGHHRETPGCSDNCLRIDIGPVAYSLVEIAGKLVKRMFDYRIADKVEIVGFITHQKIDRREFSGLYLGYQRAALGSYIYRTFGHNKQRYQFYWYFPPADEKGRSAK